MYDNNGRRIRDRSQPLKRKTKSTLQQLKEQIKNKTELSGNTSNSARIITNLKTKLNHLDDDIKNDQSGCEDYEAQLKRLEIRKADLRRIIQENTEFCEEFDRQIGPFEAKYAQLRTSINGLYNDAKSKHAAGITLLKTHFGYHPAFKRWFDDFSAVPFKPK